MRSDLKAYLDGELGGWHRWQVRWHIRRCAECREELLWLQRLGSDMRTLEQAYPRPELRARILASLPSTPPARPIEANRQPVSRAPLGRTPRYALASFACLLLFTGAFAAWRRLQTESPTPTPSPDRFLTAVPRPVAPVRKETPSPPASSTWKGYTDPISQEAERIAQERLAEAERLRVQLKRFAPPPARGIASASTKAEEATLQLTLTVAETATARKQLKALAQTLAGTVVPVSLGTSGTSHPSNPSLATPIPESQLPDSATFSATSKQPDHLVALRIPTENVPKLIPALKKIGTLATTTGETPSAANPPKPVPLPRGSAKPVMVKPHEDVAIVVVRLQPPSH